MRFESIGAAAFSFRAFPQLLQNFARRRVLGVAFRTRDRLRRHFLGLRSRLHLSPRSDFDREGFPHVAGWLEDHPQKLIDRVIAESEELPRTLIQLLPKVCAFVLEKHGYEQAR